MSAADDQKAVATTIYRNEHFERFQAVTAMDILRRIPGTAIVLAALDDLAEDAEIRGLGSLRGRILVNGRRIVGKPGDLLERIPASQVSSVELTRGASPENRLRSKGVLINVVLAKGARVPYGGRWSGGGVYVAGTGFVPTAAVSYSGNLRKLDYFFSTRLGAPVFRRQLRPQRLLAPQGGVIEFRDGVRDERVQRRTFSSRIDYAPNPDEEWRLNGFLADRKERSLEIRDRFPAGDKAAATVPREFRHRDEDGLLWEIGADYRGRLGAGRMGARALYRHEELHQDGIRNVLIDGEPRFASRGITASASTEAIVRGSFQWDVAARQTLTLGLETGFKRFETTFDFLVDQDDEILHSDLFNTDTAVEEIRLGAFSRHHWKITERWTLEDELVAEASRIEQAGPDVARSRRFFFLKPAFDLLFAFSRSTVFRLRLERTIGQLDFSNFVVTFDPLRNRLHAGNPELLPQRSWVLELGYTHRLRNDGGILALRTFYNDIHDYVDRVALAPTRSAEGNLGPGRLYGAEIDASLRLAPLGLPDVIVNVELLAQKSRVLDPLTVSHRTFSRTPSLSWTFGFRHELLQRRISYGVELSDEGLEHVYDIDVVRMFDHRADLEIFLETRLADGISLRVEAHSLLKGRMDREALRYTVNRGAGEILRIEKLRRSMEPRIAATVRGSF